MARQRKSDQKPIEQYDHRGKQRVNNPPIGLVTPETDPEVGSKKYSYDPHLDPQLIWAGKAEHTTFEVPTVSLHVHERIDPNTIIKAVRQQQPEQEEQMSLFQAPEENRPIREAIEFYQHRHNWSNRLIAGDSLLVMNSLLEKEGMAGQVQMIYIDPPYGIRYGSNFQPFVNKRDVKDGKDEDLTQEPEMIKAFRDTWELGIHSYLTYLRDRLFLVKELLSESGSVFVQIGDDNVHLVRNLLSEIFLPENFIGEIILQKTSGQDQMFLDSTCDFLIWFAKSKASLKYRQIYIEKTIGGKGAKLDQFRFVELNDGTRRALEQTEIEDPSSIPTSAKLYRYTLPTSRGSGGDTVFSIKIDSEQFLPSQGRHWSTHEEGMKRLISIGRIVPTGRTLSYVKFFDDFPAYPLNNLWNDVATASFGGRKKQYIVETNPKILERCMLMTTDPGDLVFDPTCGSGTTAYVAEQWGRRWITCDTSRVSITLAKQRLMTASFDYYQLAYPDEGVGSGFKYKTVPHITLKSIANNPEIREGMTREEIERAIQKYADEEKLYDQPLIDRSKARITGPFTVEAVPSPVVKPLDEAENPTPVADASVARSGETLRQAELRDELLKTGIRGKNGQYILFSRVEPLPGTGWLHADTETRPNDRGSGSVKEGNGTYDKPLRAVISFGPEHTPLDQRQVELAIEEARSLVPRPKLVVFAAFQFDPEAAKDIDETNWPGVTLLKVQMNADLLTEDLKKKRASNDSFWLIGQPDVALRRINRGEDTGKWEVEVHGFDYYNTKTGNIESGSVERIAMWMLDTNYDGRSLFPRQVFFPMAGEKEGWSRLARNLKAEIDEDLIESYRSTVSLPFEIGDYKRVAVKIVDDRGIESLKIIRLT